MIKLLIHWVLSALTLLVIAHFLHGFVVLAWIREQAYLNDTHVIILTSSMEDQDREKAAAFGSPYLVKPPTPQMLLEAIRSLGLSLSPA